MTKKFSFSNFLKWLKSREIFARPSKMLPGKWQLFEYYVEIGDNLLNIKEPELLQQKVSMLIDFRNDKTIVIQENLDIMIFKDFVGGGWLRNSNFVTLVNNEKHERMLAFQFDASKDQLKLLKKDSKGKIEFFGFFKRVG